MEVKMVFYVMIVLLCFIVTNKAVDVFVTVEEGTLRGETAISLYGTNYTRFMGIPYAAPPVGDLRFEPPQPVSSWEGTRDALHESAVCPQATGGSEDCLYLNVYIPPTTSTDLLPVLFWVPGGGFVYGGGTLGIYGPDFLLEYDIILVTMNYRLGPIGFLGLEDEVVPGNMGVKDMVAALQWAQRNIASFGGDPQQVTLGGESAAAAALSMMLVSPLTQGLFSRIILISGNMIGPWTFVNNPRDFAFRLGAALGIETDDSQELVDYLRTLNASELLVSNADILTEEESYALWQGLWAPVVEPESEGAFITQRPTDLLKSGQLQQMPIYTGVTSGEFGVYNLDSNAVLLNDHYDAAVAPCLRLPTEEERLAAAQQLRTFYFGDAVTISANSTPWGVVNITNDIGFVDPVNSFVRYVVNTTTVPVYYYMFNYSNTGASMYGVGHSSDLPYIFVRNDTAQNTDPTSEEEQVRQNYLRLFTNFIKIGNPTPEADPVVWPPYDLQSKPYMWFQSTFSIANDLFAERMDFWEETIPF